MKICTGDESGLLKLIDFDPSSAIPNPSKKLKSNTSKPVPVECSTVGIVDKKAAICCISEINCNHFMVARLNGIVEVVNFENDEKKNYKKKLFEPSFSLNKVKKPLHFIGLHTYDNLVITCTDTGMVTFDLIDTTLPSSEGITPCTVSLCQTDLCVMKVHPKFPNIFCTGGYERDLCIWDIKNWKESERFEPIWKSKNVQNNYLDMRVPVWVTCIVWMHDNNSYGNFNLLVGTGYHQIRVYNTKKQKRPILDFDVGHHPVKALTETYHNEFLFSDTAGNVTAINSTSGIVTGKYRGVAGAVTDIFACKHQPYVVMVALDRRLRIFEELNQRRMVKDVIMSLSKVFLKQHLSCLSVVESPPEEIIDEQDLWETIAVVENEKEELSSVSSEGGYKSDTHEELVQVERYKKRVLSN